MNTRMLNVILVGLNLSFLGVIGLLIYLQKTTPPPPVELLPARLLTNTVTQIAVRKINATNLLAALASRNVSWANLESTNYYVYIANLRAFGVPEETIRDIIIADVSKMYGRQRAALRAQEERPKFWHTGEAWETDGASNPALRRQLRELEEEQRELLRQLLGIDYKAELTKYWEGEDPQERKYDFLSPEKRDKLVALQEKYEALEQELYSRTKGLIMDEDQEQLRRLEKQREAEMAQLLTPQELEDYQVRHSATANSLRYQLSGFEPTEEEFRKIFHLQKTFDDEFSTGFDATDEKQADIRARAQQNAQEALDEEIKKVLGDQRYTEYQRAQDGDYKALVQLAERFEMPREVASKVYEMKMEAQRQKQAIETAANLTDEQRQGALDAIARETERSVAQIMGDKIFKAYRRANGQWINNLTALPEPELPITEPEQ
jgi:hypothetical protein